MMNGELLRNIVAIAQEKDIDKEVLFESIESALLTAVKKKLGNAEDITVQIDRESGEIKVLEGGSRIIPIDLGRIAAQTAKQVIIQKIRDAESDGVLREYTTRDHSIVTGTIQRFEGMNLIINLGKTEAVLPKLEQVRGETYHIGDRVRAYVLEVKKAGPKVRIVLSRTHPDFIKRLFEVEVPEIAERIIEIKKLVREPGYRTKIAVSSTDLKIDCVGACVGVRGQRIKNIIDELNGEKIDIIRWNDDPEMLIANALKPAAVTRITLEEERRSALVIVEEDQLSLAIGKRGQNVRLASKLCGWDLDIVTQKELDERQAGTPDGSRGPGPVGESDADGQERSGDSGDDGPNVLPSSDEPAAFSGETGGV
ncbi:MAG: transcription termination/antitermination protein NusA [Planctomycetes bacterium]|nr:transcription termination/antitermination protein NusA [Planctomycetota bacterium]